MHFFWEEQVFQFEFSESRRVSINAAAASEATCIIRPDSFAGSWFKRSVTEMCPGADGILCACICPVA